MAGVLTTNQIQLGDSSTPANNFVLKTNTDGTAVLSRGNVGATTGDIFKVNVDGTITFNNKINVPANGILSGVYNNTGATSDIVLPIGGTAYITAVNAPVIPLRISVLDNQIYEIYTTNINAPANQTASPYLQPNNADTPSTLRYLHGVGTSVANSALTNALGFVLGTSSVLSSKTTVFVSTTSFSRSLSIFGTTTSTQSIMGVTECESQSIISSWSSLGTLITMQNIWSGTVVVRRII